MGHIQLELIGICSASVVLRSTVRRSQLPLLCYAALSLTMSAAPTHAGEGTGSRARTHADPAGGSIYTLALDPVMPTTIYGGASGLFGLFKSTTGGDNWTLANSGFSAPFIWTLAIDP